MIEDSGDIDLIKNPLKMALLFLNFQYLYSITNSLLRIAGLILLVFLFQTKKTMDSPRAWKTKSSIWKPSEILQKGKQ